MLLRLQLFCQISTKSMENICHNFFLYFDIMFSCFYIVFDSLDILQVCILFSADLIFILALLLLNYFFISFTIDFGSFDIMFAILKTFSAFHTYGFVLILFSAFLYQIKDPQFRRKIHHCSHW